MATPEALLILMGSQATTQLRTVEALTASLSQTRATEGMLKKAQADLAAAQKKITEFETERETVKATENKAENA